MTKMIFFPVGQIFISVHMNNFKVTTVADHILEYIWFYFSKKIMGVIC